MFENDVKMYGIQTIWECSKSSELFENDVKMYGIQTRIMLFTKRSIVWEWCKNVWYSNSNGIKTNVVTVWEWCKNVWYSNWYKPIMVYIKFENDVKMYGIQTKEVS